MKNKVSSSSPNERRKANQERGRKGEREKERDSPLRHLPETTLTSLEGLRCESFEVVSCEGLPGVVGELARGVEVVFRFFVDLRGDWDVSGSIEDEIEGEGGNLDKRESKNKEGGVGERWRREARRCQSRERRKTEKRRSEGGKVGTTRT